MPIPTRCPACGAEQAVADTLAGKLVLCRCGAGVPVPRDGAKPARHSLAATALMVFGLVALSALVVCGGSGTLGVYLLKDRFGRGVAQRPHPPRDGERTTDDQPDDGKPGDKKRETPPEKPPEKPPQPAELASIDEALAALKSADMRQQSAAARWLGQRPRDATRRAEVAAALAELLQGRPGPAAHALDALAIWATKENIPALTEFLDRACVGPAGQLLGPKAVAALAAIDDPAVGKILAGQLDRGHADAARQALVKLGPKALPDVLPYFNAPREPVRRRARELASEWKAGDDLLTKRCAEDVKSSQPERVRQAAEWLATAKADDTRRARVARALEGALDSPEPAAVAAAVSGLLTWGDAESVPKLAAVLAAGAPEGETRRRLIAWLGRSKDPRAVPALLARLSGTDEPAAAAALKALGPDAAPELRKFVEGQGEPALREAAIRTLKTFPGNEGLEVTVSLADIQSTDPARQQAGFERLTPLKVTGAQRAEALKGALAAYQAVPAGQTIGPSVVAARKLLTAWTAKEDVPHLLTLLASPDDRLSYLAMTLLAPLKDDRALTPLLAYLSKHPSQYEAERAIAAFETAAEKLLIGRLKSDDPRGRAALCRLLGHIGTREHALPFLTDLQKRATEVGDKELAEQAKVGLDALRTRGVR